MVSKSRLSMVVGCLWGAVILVGCAAIRGDDRGTSKEALPSAVLKAIRAEFPAAEVEEVNRTWEKGVRLFEVELVQGKQETELAISPEGVIVEVRKDVAAKDLPKAVTDALAKAAPGQIKEATKKEVRAEARLNKLESAKVVYIADIEKDDEEGEIGIAADGSVVQAVKWDDDDEEGEEDHEGKSGKRHGMNLAELQKVADAIEAQRPQATLGAVKTEKEDGLLLYVVELLEGSTKSEAMVSSDGVVVKIETEVAPAALPKEVSAAIAKAAPGAHVVEAERCETLAVAVLVPLPSPQVLFGVEVKGKGEITVGADGSIPEAQGKKVKGQSQTFRDTFPVDKANLAATGASPYFIALIPGTRLSYVAKNGQDTLQLTILNETRVVDGVTTAILEERESVKGQLEEVSRNFFALDKTTGDVYYFGEEVDIYEDGKIVKHEGAWESGVDNARFGLMLPGKPQIGDRFYQEIAKNAMDRAEITSLTAEIQTPAGTFSNCLRIKETSAIESGSSEKVFAPGVGMIKDDSFLLTKIEKLE